MLLTPLAVVLAGVWLIVQSRSTVSDTLTLIFGIVIAVLALLDAIRPYWHRAPS
jgi:hypothetical protein